MVKLVFLCRRRAALSHDEYVRRVLEGHVPLALAHHPSMRGYVVNVVEGVGEGLPEIDTVAELWFDDLAAYRERLYDSPAGRAAIERDVASFMGGAEALCTTEHVQRRRDVPAPLGTRSPGVKLVCPVRRRPGLSHDAFVAHWLERHVPLALRHHPGLSAYVTNVVDGRPDGSPADWDGIAELHFPSEDALRAGLFDSPAGEAAIRADMARFIGFTGAYRVAEWVQRRPA
jgi:uncharacterized protein (TIGR02118 family)